MGLGELVARVRAVEVPDGDPARLAEVAVDATDGVLHERALLRVVRQVGAGGHRDLDERDLAAPRREERQEAPERAQALRDALGVVEPIDAEHQPAGRDRLEQGGDLLRVLCSSGGFLEALRADPDGEGADADAPPAELDHVVAHARGRERAHAAAEVVDVAAGVQADEVELEHLIEDPVRPGDDREADRARGRARGGTGRAARDAPGAGARRRGATTGGSRAPRR